MDRLKVWYIVGFRPEIERAPNPRDAHIEMKARLMSPAVLEEEDFTRLPVGHGLEFSDEELQPLRDAMRRARGL